MKTVNHAPDPISLEMCLRNFQTNTYIKQNSNFLQENTWNTKDACDISNSAFSLGSAAGFHYNSRKKKQR